MRIIKRVYKIVSTLLRSVPANVLTFQISLVSGEALASLEAQSSSNVEALMERLKTCLQINQKLLHLLDGSTLLKAEHTLSSYGFEDRSSLVAVIDVVPILHVLRPCSAIDLTREWELGIDVTYPTLFPMHGVSQDTFDVAHELAIALPGMHIQSGLIGLNSRGVGRVIAISNPRADTKTTCLEALSLPCVIGEGSIIASIRERDWSATWQHGFGRTSLACNSVRNENYDETAITKLMAHRLDGGFIFSYQSMNGCVKHYRVPIIYGGYSVDGSIVGILTDSSPTAVFDAVLVKTPAWRERLTRRYDL